MIRARLRFLSGQKLELLYFGNGVYGHTLRHNTRQGVHLIIYHALHFVFITP